MPDAPTPDSLQFDREHIWHPYSSLTAPTPVFPVQAAEGCRLQLTDGRWLIDGMASWWSVIHGYNHPALNAAIKDQTDRFAHVMFGGLTHEPAIALCQKLVAMTPDGLDKVFLADSGSVSVEVAIKMALQYQLSQGRTEKHRLLALRGGYHGDTFGAMAVCDPVNGMHHLFQPLLPQHLFAERPACRFDEPCEPRHVAALEALFVEHHHELAAMILEPVAQGAGGMYFYAPDYLRRVRELCDEYDVLLILDEIATGFGRTGRLFASEHAGITPDILCLGKALTGGTLTLAATLCRDSVARGIGEGEAGALMHGPTFMANPLACASANASLSLLAEGTWQTQVTRIEQQLTERLAPARDLPGVSDVRVLGAIGVIELDAPVDMAVWQPALVDAGVWVRPFGKLLYIMPPYVIDDDALVHLTRAMLTVIRDHGNDTRS